VTNAHRARLDPLRAPAATWPAGNRQWMETIATWLLSLTAVFAPLALGSSGEWPALVLELTCVAAICLWAVSGSRQHSLTAVPLLLTGLLSLQLAPLPDWLLVRVAPVSAGAWKVAHEGLGDAWGRVSVDPHATTAGLRLMLIALATGTTIVGLARFQSRRRIFLLGGAASGLMILLAAYAFPTVGDEFRVLGIFDARGPLTPMSNPVLPAVQTSGVGLEEWVAIGDQRYQMDAGNFGHAVGSYLYANHFAGGVCLTLPLLLAAWLWLAHERIPTATCWAVACLIIAAAFWAVHDFADSRAGTLTLAISCVALVGGTSTHPWIRRVAAGIVWIGASLALGFAILVLSPAAAFISRMPREAQATLQPLLSDARIVSARVAIRAFWASPLLGTGVATYEDIYPRFYRDKFVLFYAHNDYAQLLAETGLAGAAIAVIFAVLLGTKALLFFRAATGAYRLLNAGPWAAVAGIATYSAFDWNLHLPANAFLAVLVTALAFSSVPATEIAQRLRELLARYIPEFVPRAALVLACLSAVPYFVRDAFSEAAQRDLRSAIVADRLHGADQKKNPPAADHLDTAIAAGERMTAWDRANSKLFLALGQARLHFANTLSDPAARRTVTDAAELDFRKATLASAARRGLAERITPLPKSR